MSFVTKREVDLSPEEKAALLHLSRTLGMKDGYTTITYDEAVLCDVLTPVAPVPSATPEPEEVVAAQEEIVLPPVVSPAEVVSEEVGKEVEEENTTTDEKEEPSLSSL